MSSSVSLSVASLYALFLDVVSTNSIISLIYAPFFPLMSVHKFLNPLEFLNAESTLSHLNNILKVSLFFFRLFCWHEKYGNSSSFQSSKKGQHSYWRTLGLFSQLFFRVYNTNSYGQSIFIWRTTKKMQIFHSYTFSQINVVHKKVTWLIYLNRTSVKTLDRISSKNWKALTGTSLQHYNFCKEDCDFRVRIAA